VKWEPLLAMTLLLVLAVWLVAGADRAELHGIDIAPGSKVHELRIGNERGILEVLPPPPAAAHAEPRADGLRGPWGDTGEPSFRVHLRNGHASYAMTAQEFREVFGDQALRGVTAAGGNALFRLLNITSWAGLIWVAIGFTGQAAFFGRMLVQWIVSESQRRSVVPEAFWWLSLAGGVMLFAYFIWRQDIVGVLGQTTGVVIYARNIRLIHKHRRREAATAAADPASAAA